MSTNEGVPKHWRWCSLALDESTKFNPSALASALTSAFASALALASALAFALALASAFAFAAALALASPWVLASAFAFPFAFKFPRQASDDKDKCKPQYRTQVPAFFIITLLILTCVLHWGLHLSSDACLRNLKVYISHRVLVLGI